MRELDLDALPAFSSFPGAIQGDLRSDHAGETGAVFIYHGILAVSRDPAIREFARAHLATEERHLAAFQQWLEPRDKSRLIGLWKIAGWCLGACAALGGARGVYVTIEAVERFVVEHYAQQLPALATRQEWEPVHAMLSEFMHEEDHHREDAAERKQGSPGPLARLWMHLVGSGSAAAVVLARAI